MKTKPHKTRNRWSATALALAIAAPFAIPGGPLAGATDSGVDDLIASLEGGWVGDDNDTPFGKMGFAVLFAWTPEGDLHSRSPLNSETYIDLRFEKDDAGRWLLHEEAAMEGLGAQKYSLAPVSGLTEAGHHRWVWEENPGYLAIDVGLEGETMALDVTLRGKPHVSFRLERQPREHWAEMKRAMLAQAELSPSDGVSIAEVVSTPPPHLAAALDEEDPIQRARRAVAADPEAGTAHLDLARAIAQAIERDPANGPRYAFEMLSALQTAVRLEPKLAEAYHYLVGYYLNAPPVAGGSADKAEETAHALAEFDPAGGEALLSQVEAFRARQRDGGGSGSRR